METKPKAFYSVTVEVYVDSENPSGAGDMVALALRRAGYKENDTYADKTFKVTDINF